MDKQIFKKSDEELQLYLQLMSKHSIVKNKKGKGSYNRAKIKEDLRNGKIN